MSKIALPFIQGSQASAPVSAAVAQVLSKIAPSIALQTVNPKDAAAAAQSTSRGIAIGQGLSADEVASLGGGVHSAVTIPNVALNADYANFNVAVYRAIISDPTPVAIRFRDRVDVFPGQGLDTEAENAAVLASATQTARLALEAAKARKQSRVSLVLKPLTRYNNLNKLFTDAATSVFAGSGIELDSVNTQAINNQLVMFPESLGVLLTNDVSASDITEGIAIGLAGGAGVSYTSYYGKSLSAFVGAKSAVNPAGTLFATAAALSKLGLDTEAQKLNAALKQSLNTAANRTTDFEGGKLDAAGFAKLFA